MGSSANSYIDDIEKEMNDEKLQDLQKAIQKISQLDIQSQEYTDFMWMWRNRTKVYAAQGIINLLKI